MVAVSEKCTTLRLTRLGVGGVLLFNALLFQPILEELFPPFSYFDEVFAAGCGVFLVFAVVQNREMPLRYWVMAAGVALMVCVGLIGNALSGLPSHPQSILIDMLASTKFIIVFLALSVGLSKTDQVVRCLDIEARVILAAAFGCLLVNQIGDLGMTYEVRYGLKSFQFIYIHPSHLVTMSLACLMVVFANGRPRWQLFVAAALILTAASLRSRWVALALIAAVFVLAGPARLKRFFVPISVAAAGIAIALGASQMSVYYGSDSPAARNQLATASLDIFMNGLPFGTGFGTFGTGVTKTDYSALYYEYGFHNVPGLSPEFPSYITDTFWPAILAEFGFIGLLVWLGLLSFMVFELYRQGEGGGVVILALIFIAALVIASTSSGAIFSMQMITLLFVFLLISKRQFCERRS